MLKDFQVEITVHNVELEIEDTDEIKFELELKKKHAWNKIYNAIQKQIDENFAELYNEITEFDEEYSG